MSVVSHSKLERPVTLQDKAPKVLIRGPRFRSVVDLLV